jgi:hypothetical protein
MSRSIHVSIWVSTLGFMKSHLAAWPCRFEPCLRHHDHEGRRQP